MHKNTMGSDPEFDPWASHDGRRELTAMSCSLISTHVLWCIGSYTKTCTQRTQI